MGNCQNGNTCKIYTVAYAKMKSRRSKDYEKFLTQEAVRFQKMS